jgi:hypothetical protein
VVRSGCAALVPSTPHSSSILLPLPPLSIHGRAVFRNQTCDQKLTISCLVIVAYYSGRAALQDQVCSVSSWALLGSKCCAAGA